MKLSSIFKKKANKEAKQMAQALDKKQLEKVMGGTEVRIDQKGVKALDGNPTI